MASPPRSLERESDYFRIVAEHARDALVCASRHGTITYFNPAAERMFGYSAEEALGRPLTLLMPTDLQEAHRQGLARFTRTGEPTILGRVVDVDAQRRDGVRFRVELIVSHAGSGEDSTFVGILRDVSERVDAAGALARSEERYRLLFENNPLPMWVFDAESLRFLAVNEAAVTDYGYSKDEFLSMTVRDVRPEEDLPRLADRMAGRLPKLSDPAVFRHRKKSGARIDVEIRSHEVAFEGRDARLVLAQDVSARNQSAEALRESERRFREMLENMSLVAVVLDVMGRITFCNDYLADLVGIAKPGLIGESWFARCIPEDERAALEGGFLARVGSGAISAHDRNDVITRTGDRRTIAWSNTVLRGPDGAVVGTASIGIDVTDERRAKERLEHDALHDALTGLPNRSLFLDRLNGARARASRKDGLAFAVLLMDLDRFKLVNDGLGHTVGDELLVAASKAISGCVQEGDTVARLGGDEFAVLLEGVRGAEDATRVATRIHEALASPFRLAGHEVFTTASIGIALGSEGYSRAEDAVRDAHTAMYGAKALGASRHVVFKGSMRMRAVRLLQMETDLRRALERKELQLHYQPIVLLDSGQLLGFEALVRWNHPTRGMVSPLEFIPIAEETGLILPIGRWVLDEACACMRRWERRLERPLPITINVNLSGRQFAQADFPAEIDQVLASTGLDPTRLKLEVTETVLMENADSARLILEALRARGVHLCIDDFGTGYSSLAYLVRLPVHTIKVDRAFVRGMNERGESFEIVRTIVTLAKNLGMDVVAEGVETEEQRTRLRELGCERGQGYLFSRPVDEAAAWALLAARRE